MALGPVDSAWSMLVWASTAAIRRLLTVFMKPSCEGTSIIPQLVVAGPNKTVVASVGIEAGGGDETPLSTSSVASTSGLRATPNPADAASTTKKWWS